MHQSHYKPHNRQWTSKGPVPINRYLPRHVILRGKDDQTKHYLKQEQKEINQQASSYQASQC